ncbi:hypothetical protein NGM10_11355 [Halorussus salilacus]|uniref:hypothetical protein n=1 Tax=Halorussus salilacus TaxID=2953750 RepID=UPI00209E4593|nr:hypothetical protein [Halorussus salilacus]USZ67326.1 hypothetical protein NGM10_11355 [Halorussus salilacus]
MVAQAVTRWARWFVAASAVFLVAWQAAALADVPRQTRVVLAVHGFVLHAVFGKAYSLVPSYFDRSLAFVRAPAVHFPLTAVGVVGLAVAPLPGTPSAVGPLAAALWTAGVVVFVATLAWTVRGNPTGRETGTGGPNAHRRGVDRYANAFVPVVLAYLLAGAYGTLGAFGGLTAAVAALPATGSAPNAGALPALGIAQTAHLLAAGTAALLIFAVGFRLFPRFLVASPPRALVAAVLPAGAIAPALLAWDFYGATGFRVGATLQAVAVVGFALAYAALFARSERRRVGFYAVLVGVGCGVLGVTLGLHFAFVGVAGELLAVHFRLNVLGFLGLTIIGATYQFYPPSVGTFRGASDRTALASVLLVGAGLLAEVGGALAGSEMAVLAGRGGALVGTAVFAGLVLGVFLER